MIKDIVLSVAAMTGAVVAIKGLGTWQRQLKGQSEYELSRRILVTVFKYRDAINNVRQPAMWAYEMPMPPKDEAKTMNHNQIRFYGKSKAYQARWDKVQAERTSLYADLLEAEVTWGNELKYLFKKVFDLENELSTCIRYYIELINPDTDEALKEVLGEIYKKNRNIIYGNTSEESDEYKNDLISAIENIEKFLKLKLSWG